MTSPARPPEAPLEPRLSAFDTAMVTVSLVIGIGIFRTPALVAREAGSAGAFLGAWALGGAVSLAGALTFAEIGSRLPRAGGYYRVVAECFHPRLAFMLNWSQAILQGAGAAGVAFIGAEYLGLVALPAALRTPQATLTLALALMVTLLLLSLAGVRSGARAQNLLSLSKIALIAGLAVTALALGPAEPGGTAPLATGGGWSGFAAAAVAVFYTYGGYQCTMNLGGDVREAPRNLPRGVLLGMALVLLLYLGINLAYLHTLGLAGVAGAPLAAAALARAVLGPAGETLVALAIFLSAAGFVNATILQVPRSYRAMAEDGALPAALGRVNPRTQAQEAGLAFFALTLLGPAFLLGSFEKLLSYVMFSDALALATVAACVFVLRRRARGRAAEGVFRAPAYPWLPSLFVAVLLAVAARVAWTEPRLALAGLVVLLLGAPLFELGRRATGARPLAPRPPC